MFPIRRSVVCRLRSTMLGLVLLGLPSTARAVTYYVDRTDDALVSACTGAANDCTLRGAITAANNSVSNDLILFGPLAFPAPRKTITLGGTTLPIISAGSGKLTINAPPAGVVISGNNQSRIFTIFNGGDLSLIQLTLRDGSGSAPGFGGAIQSSGTLLLDSCTLTANSAASGGAIFSDSAAANNALTLINCTLSGNQATDSGGAIYKGDGHAVIAASTITDNEAPLGSGCFATSADTAQVSSSIIVGNTNTDVDGPTAGYQSDGYNLIGDGAAIAAFVQPGDQVIGNASPGLEALADNGGPTQTRALLATSPAIDAGGSRYVVDQRGVARPQGAQHDIGAYEFEFDESLVVTTTTDEDNSTSDPGFGTGTSLREAIDSANTDGTNSAITFAEKSGQAFFGPRKTLTLVGKQLPALLGDGALSITAPIAGVVIKAAAVSRIFQVGSTASVTLRGLTLTGGSINGAGGFGGAIQNTGNLFIERCTLFDNAAVYGGAIHSNINGAGRTLTLRNCTLSGNRASVRGGAIFNETGLAIIQSCTIAGNEAPSGGGSGIAATGAAPARTQVSNSIIAGNLNTDVDFVAAAVNPFESLGYNLIGDGNAGPEFVEVGDQRIGNAAPGLAALGEYGGSTPTRALIAGSLAINKGDPTSMAPPTDQRGYARVGVPDIGAFEFGATAPKLRPHNDRLEPSGEVSDGVGKGRIFRATYSDPNGYRDIRYVYLQVKSGSTNVLRVAYDVPNNKLYLLKADGTGYLGGVKPGTDVVLNNGIGLFSCKATKARALDTNTMQVDWVIAASTPLAGAAHPVLLYVTDKSNLSDGFDRGATWTITSQ